MLNIVFKNTSHSDAIGLFQFSGISALYYWAKDNFLQTEINF